MIKIATVIFAIVILAGCTQTTDPNTETVKIVDLCGSENITITDIKERKRSDGFMQAQVIGENSSDQYQQLEYQIIWFNKDGFIIESILSKWRKIPAYANQPFYIQDISPSTEADKFKVYLRQEKEVICSKHSDGY